MQTGVGSRNDENEVCLLNDIENVRVDTCTCVDDDILEVFLYRAAYINYLLCVYACERLGSAEEVEVISHGYLCNSLESSFSACENVTEVISDIVLDAEDDVETSQTEVELD